MSQLKPRPCSMRGNSTGRRIALTEKLRLTALSTSSSRKSSSLLTTRQRNLSGIGEAYTILATQTSPKPEARKLPDASHEVMGYSQPPSAKSAAVPGKLCASYVRLVRCASCAAMFDSNLRLAE